jgi:hypothetical protein
MASAIDATKPVAGSPTTQSVRDNFAAAKSEITALQAAVPTWTVGSVPFATSTTALGQDNANLFYDNANDRLGIGTAAPGAKLTVSGNTAALQAPPTGTLAHYGNADTSLARVLIDSYGNGNASQLALRSAGGTAAAPTSMVLGQELGRVAGFGWGGSAYSGGQATVTMVTTEAWTATARGCATFFVTTPNGASAGVEAMRIDHTGNVGIGLTPTTGRLEVRDAVDRVFRVTSGIALGGVDGVGIQSANDPSTVSKQMSYHASSHYFAGPVGAGNVGIGTAGPADKLDVAGNLKVGSTSNDGVIGFGSGGAATAAGIYAGRNLDSPSGLSIGGYSGIWFHTNDTWNAPGVLKAIFDSTNTRNVSGAWAVISGLETKQDVAPYTRGLDAVLQLNPVSFRYKPGTPFASPDEPSKPLFGLIADEVKPIVPEIVGQTTMTVAGKQDVPVDCLEPGNLIYALLNAVKTLAARLDILEGKAVTGNTG